MKLYDDPQDAPDFDDDTPEFEEDAHEENIPLEKEFPELWAEDDHGKDVW